MADLGAVAKRLLNADAKRTVTVTPTYATFTAIRPYYVLHRLTQDGFYAARAFDGNPGLANVPSYHRYIDGRVATDIWAERQVRGTVVNSSDVGIARNVVITTGGGSLVAKGRSTSDGFFSLRVGNAGTQPLMIQGLPDPGDNRNAAVKWRVVPVAPT